MTCPCGCGAEPKSPARKHAQYAWGHNQRVSPNIPRHPFTKAERNLRILETLTADKTWGAASRLSRELGISRERVRQIYNRERKRVA